MPYTDFTDHNICQCVHKYGRTGKILIPFGNGFLMIPVGID